MVTGRSACSKIEVYARKDLNNLKWAFLVLRRAIELSMGMNAGSYVIIEGEVGTSEAEEAALSLGMARGTGRAALSRLAREGMVKREGRGRWSVSASIVRASWPGEALMLLAARGDDELAEARRGFVEAAVRGWRRGEREAVRQVAQASFRELWRSVREAVRDKIVILEPADTGLRMDRQGMMKLARYLARFSAAIICGLRDR